jgi:hypothetical protein
MTENELELINLIRESGNPEAALMAALDVLTDYLSRHVSYQEQYAVDLRELA